MRFCLSVLVLVLASSLAQAKPIRGPGTEPCTSLASESRDTVADLYHFWLLGYLSAKNVAGDDPDFFGQVESSRLFAWVDQFCREHPSDHVYEAADALIDALKKNAN
jgi:hypothetical protein